MPTLEFKQLARGELMKQRTYPMYDMTLHPPLDSPPFFWDVAPRHTVGSGPDIICPISEAKAFIYQIVWAGTSVVSHILCEWQDWGDPDDRNGVRLTFVGWHNSPPPNWRGPPSEPFPPWYDEETVPPPYVGLSMPNVKTIWERLLED